MVALMTVFKKELEDHFNNWRFIIVFLVVFAPAIYYIWHAAIALKDTISSTDYFFFLPVFTSTLMSDPPALLPNTFLQLIAVLLPLVGIALGLDAINSEKNNGTLSRLISQPIYRDSVINAKFLAGIVAISVLVTSIVLISVAITMRVIGIVPTIEEIWRIFLFLVIAIIYGAFWLGLSVLLSTLFKRVVTSAMVALAIWLFFAIFFPLIMQLIPISTTSDQSLLNSMNLIINLYRISPIQLFNESMALVLLPAARTLSQYLIIASTDVQYYLLDTPLSLGQSLLIVWPQIMTTLLLTVICFAASYIKFMREEIRST
jgi:ABC-2 type transport system permease protein